MSINTDTPVEFTAYHAEMLTEMHAAVTEVKALLEQAEPLLESFFGKPGEPAAPANPMLAIAASLMGGRR